MFSFEIRVIINHHHKPGVVALRYGSPGWSSLKPMGVPYKIVAVHFASRPYVSRGNCANIRPILKTDTRLVGIPIKL